jgi:hypothetical protein
MPNHIVAIDKQSQEPIEGVGLGEVDARVNEVDVGRLLGKDLIQGRPDLGTGKGPADRLQVGGVQEPVYVMVMNPVGAPQVGPRPSMLGPSNPPFDQAKEIPAAPPFGGCPTR